MTDIATLGSHQVQIRIQKEDPLQGSFNTVETCVDLTEHSFSPGPSEELLCVPLEEGSSSSFLEDDEYDEVTVNTVNTEYEERTIEPEDETEHYSDDDDEDSLQGGLEEQKSSSKDNNDDWNASCELYGYGDATPDIAKTKQSSPMPVFRRSSLSCGSGPGPRRSSMKQGAGSRRASLVSGQEIEIHLPGRDRPVRRRSSIVFCEAKNEVKPVVPVTELTDNAKELWYQSKDYDRIQERNYDVVDLAQEGYNYCTRGLEDLMDDDDSEKRYEAVDAVLDEHEAQQKKGVFDPEAISRVYRLSAISSKVEAKMRAKDDEKEVQRYLRETRRYCRRLSM